MMNIALWVVQGLLAAVFVGSGSAKSLMGRQRLIETGQTGIALFPMPVVRFTAVAELCAAMGLILPWATGIAPVLTPLAALGLCIVMVGAASSHARLREPGPVAANTVLFALALWVAAARFAAL